MHFLGIDWATDKHDLCLLAEDGRILSEFSIAHDAQGFERLREVLNQLPDIAINIERADGLLVDWLQSNHYPVYLTTPSVVARRRPRRTKNDRGDAYLLAYLLRVGDPEVRLMVQSSPIVTHLKQLAATYDMVVRQQRRLSNRLIYVLRQYYPAVLRAFKISNSLICLAFLEAYPTPESAQALTQAQLEAFLRQHRYRYMANLPRLYQEFQAPAPRARVIQGYVTGLKVLIPLLRALHQERTRLTKELDTLFKTHPEAAWWRSFPGASGPLTAARLLAWIGDDRSRFPTSGSLQAIAGTAPITRSSGKQRSVEFRRACSRPLRKTVDDLAHQSIRHSGWAASYFRDQLARGHTKARAYRALANRWLRIIWKLWQTRQPYNEAVHVANRSRRGQHAPVRGG